MANRQYYPYPPMPQRSIPPRITTPILPPDPTADVLLQRQDSLQTILLWYLPSFPVRQVYTALASLLYETPSPPDDPPFTQNVTLTRILTFRSLISLPTQKLNLSPILLGGSAVIPEVAVSFKAFQANAFQSLYPGAFYAFQAVDNIIGFSGPGNGIRVRDFLTIFVGPLMQEYARTSAIVIECQVFDPSYTPAVPIDPTSVQLNLLRPDDTSEVSLALMSNVSTGFYRYTFQSDSNDTLGVYTMNIKATNGSNVAQTITQAAFRLVA